MSGYSDSLICKARLILQWQKEEISKHITLRMYKKNVFSEPFYYKKDWKRVTAPKL